MQGGLLKINRYNVDLILRDISRVESVLEECKEGIVYFNYQLGHPHGFYNVMYIGELSIAKLLWRKNDKILKIKEEAEAYPKKMKQSIINFSKFESEFSIDLASKSVKNNDTYYISAHIVRALSQLNQLLFALNESYCLNEKRAVEIIEKLSIHPINYRMKVNSIFKDLGNNDEKALLKAKNLLSEVFHLI